MYDSLQDTATALIREFGQSVALTKPSYTGANQEYNPVTGQWEAVDGEEAGDPETGSVNAVFVGISQRWKDKFVIEQGDSIALVAGGGTLTPAQNDMLDDWTIVAIEEVNPAGTVVIYKCHVRQQ